MNKIKKININYLGVLTNIIIFLFFVYPPSDYDFGWHLRYGQFFWEQGRLLRENIISYTLPDYHWINHSWSYDIWFYPFFRAFGFLGVAIVGPLFMFAVVKVISKAIKATYFEQILGALALSFIGTHSLNEGLRSRFPIFLFLAVLYLFLSKIKSGRKKYIYLLPILFFIGANLHGQFAIGLLYLFLFWLISSYDAFTKPIKNFRNWLFLAGAGLVSGAIAIINPFGIDIYMEAFKHAINPNLRLVVEYFPPELNTLIGMGLVVYLAILVCALFFHRNSEFIKEALILIPFVYMGFEARRNVIFFILFSLPLMIKMIRPILENISKNIYYTKLFSLILCGLFVVLVFRLVPFSLLSYNWNNYCQFSSGCSEEATQFLKNNLPAGRPFTYYDWGGYLSWRLPEVKTFIDGRMHLWQIQDHYIMQEHEKLITTSGDWEKVFKDFDFAWAILPPRSNLAGKLEALSQSGLWERVYLDQQAVIYARKNN